MVKTRARLLITFFLSAIFLAFGGVYAVFFASGWQEASAAVFICAFLSGIIAIKTSADIGDSISEIVEVAKKISAGNLDQRVKVDSGGEIGYLSGVFNKIIDSFENSGKKLKEEHKETKAIISSMGEGLILVDTKLNVILMNKTAERLLEIPADKATGKYIKDVVVVFRGSKELAVEDLPLSIMLRTGKTVVIGMKENYYYKTPSGKLFPVEIVTAPFIKNGISGGVVVFKDISEMKLLEEEREFSRVNLENALKSVYIERDIVREQKNKLEAILNSIGDAVFAVDKEKKIIIFNPAAEKITGFEFKDVNNRIYSQHLKFIDEVSQKEKNDFIESALAGKSAESDNHTTLATKGKNKISVEQSTAPIKNSKNEVIGCIVVFRDVTARREVERMRSDFISIASHQLRTPLSGIKWFLEILLNKDVGALNPKQAGILKETYVNNQNMIDLVDKMLDMSRIENNRLVVNLERVKLNDTVKMILKEIKPFLDKKKQSLKLKPFPGKKMEINADKVLLKNIINNLITNASKYASSGGRITLSISRKDKHNLLFKVEDNGIGIPKKEHYKIFKKFFRASNAINYDAYGTGLGLYIVKSILDIIGGKIWFRSAENKGTVFYFTLPVDIIWCKIK